MRLFTLLSLAFTPFEMWMYGRLAGVTISTSPYAVFGIVGGLGKAACMSATLLTNLRLSGFYARHRTAIQTANSAVWLMHIVCDLSHIGMASDKEPIYVQLAILKLVALCFHTQLPLVREQMWTDVVAYTLAMAIWTTILPNGLHHESVLYPLCGASPRADLDAYSRRVERRSTAAGIGDAPRLHACGRLEEHQPRQ